MIVRRFKRFKSHESFKNKSLIGVSVGYLNISDGIGLLTLFIRGLGHQGLAFLPEVTSVTCFMCYMVPKCTKVYQSVPKYFGKV